MRTAWDRSVFAVEGGKSFREARNIEKTVKNTARKQGKTRDPD